MRYLFLLCLLLPLSLFAQKEDYVWCFEEGIGLDFKYNPPKMIHSKVTQAPNSCGGIEACASISINEGKLLFYLSSSSTSRFGMCDTISGIKYPNLYDLNNENIFGSDSINVQSSSTNGAIILPIKNRYFVITHADSFGWENGQWRNWGFLYELLLEYDTIRSVKNIIHKNKEIYKGCLAEKITAVKHANGIDWWVITHSSEYKSKTFYIYLLDVEGLKLHHSQNIGSEYQIIHNSQICNTVWGEICFSPDGSKLLSVTMEGTIDILKFNRCTGELSNYLNLTTRPPDQLRNHYTYYGSSFSPNGKYIYVSTSGELDMKDSLFQYDIRKNNIKPVKTFIATNFQGIGQHQLGPDGKIYISGIGSYTIGSIDEKVHIGVINKPDLEGVSCNFDPKFLTTNAFGGLPNMPNYRLKALGSAYTGIEKLHRICSADSVQLGYGLSEPHFIYQWQPTIGLSDPTLSSPKASPAFSVTYTLTVRPDPNNPPPCTVHDSHSDTVRVEVIEKHVPPCTSVSRPELPKPFFKVYPNPATDFVQFHYQMKETDFAQVDVYNIQGIKVKSLELVSQDTELNLPLKDLTAGTYICKITVNGSAYNTFKLIVE